MMLQDNETDQCGCHKEQTDDGKDLDADNASRGKSPKG